jgi:hypothetical protein
VKPRRTHRLSIRNDTKDRQFLDVDKDRATIAAADDALNFLRAIKVSKADLYNAELEREKLEALQAVSSMATFCQMTMPETYRYSLMNDQSKKKQRNMLQSKVIRRTIFNLCKQFIPSICVKILHTVVRT